MTSRVRAWGLAAAVGASLSCAAGAQDGAAMRAELERLDAAIVRLEGAGLPEGLAGGLGRAREGLAAVRGTRDPDLALYRLREPFVSLETLSFVAAHRPAGEDLAGLEAVWRSEGDSAARESAAAPAGLSALHLALWQAAHNRAERLHAAALPYGRVASPLAGLYYLGEAKAHRLWRDSIARAAGGPAGSGGGGQPLPAAAPDAGALESALVELEGATVAAFARDPGAPTMVAVSARLKEARELLEGGFLDGATLATLEARLALSRRLEETATAGAAPGSGTATAPGEGTAAPPAPRPAAPAAATAAPAGPAASSPRALFLALAAEDRDPATARLVARDVIPLHDRLTRSRP